MLSVPPELTVPTTGAPGGAWPAPSIDAVISAWVAFDGCPTAAHVGGTLVGAAGSANEGETATRYTYAPCRGAAEVVLWKLTGSGHVWPGGKQDVNEQFLGRPTTIIDASTHMWRFFQRHPLPR